MLKVGDTVRVIGTTVGPNSPIEELVPVGSICIVKEVQDDIALIHDRKGNQFWYSQDALEQGKLMCMKYVEGRDLDVEPSKVWKITGSGLPALEIVANSFDDAIAQARKIDTRYNTGQVKED